MLSESQGLLFSLFLFYGLNENASPLDNLGKIHGNGRSDLED
jgi:hypothetical protein